MTTATEKLEPTLYGPAYGVEPPPVPTVLGGMLTTAGVKHGHALARIPGTEVRILLPGGNDDPDPDPYVLDSFRAWTYCGRANVAGTERLSWDGLEFSTECRDCGRSFTGSQDVTP